MKKQKRTSIGLPLLLTNTEELLKRESLKTSPLFSEAETRKLSEELQLRMAEPEFQNIKLKLTSNPALDLTENYHALNEFKQSGLFTLSLKGEIIEINISGSQMLGKKSARLINKRFSNFISDDTLSVYNIFLEKVFNSKSNVSCEVTLSTKGNFPMHVLLTGIVPENGAHCIMSAVDITFCKLGKTYREMGWEILQLLDGQGDLLDSVKNVISALKVCTGLDAVGFRLQNGDDFPYFAQKGFSGDFIMTENSLVEQEENGKVCVNKDGHINLECTCGLVISGKTDPADPFSTQGGSIWSNDSFPFLGLPAGEDPRLHPRNKCISNGYASVALIPVKNKDRIVGMLQFCDRRKGCFTPDTIETLEGISSHIGIALFRKLVDDKLSLQSEILENMPEGVFLYSADDGLIVYTNPKLEHMFGYDPKELIGKHVSVVNAPNERSPEETSAEILQSLLINGIWCGEVENIRKDGTIFWSQVNVSAFEHPHYGKVWISIQQDISKRKQLEKALRESETILNNAQQIAHVGSWELDDATHELRWSEETFRIFGFEPHSVSPTMELFLQCIHPEDLPDLTESIIVAWDLRNPFSKDHRIILPDGQVRIVHEQAEIKYTDTGKPEKWMGIVQDITYGHL